MVSDLARRVPSLRFPFGKEQGALCTSLITSNLFFSMLKPLLVDLVPDLACSVPSLRFPFGTEQGALCNVSIQEYSGTFRGVGAFWSVCGRSDLRSCPRGPVASLLLLLLLLLLPHSHPSSHSHQPYFPSFPSHHPHTHNLLLPVYLPHPHPEVFIPLYNHPLSS